MKIGGCAGLKITHHVQLLFAPGESAFVLKKAQQGVLKRVVIGTTKITSPRTAEQFLSCTKDFCGIPPQDYTVVYEDTMKGLWNGDELISHSAAIALATAYYENLLSETISLGVCP